LPKRAESLAIRSAKAAGVMGAASPPRSAIRWTTAGLARIALICSFICLTMTGSTPAGA
jgi:hypothetical protein